MTNVKRSLTWKWPFINLAAHLQTCTPCRLAADSAQTLAVWAAVALCLFSILSVIVQKNQHHKTVIRRQDKQHQHCTILKQVYYCCHLTFTIIYLLVIREWSVFFICYTWLRLDWWIFNLSCKTWFLLIIASLLLPFPIHYALIFLIPPIQSMLWRIQMLWLWRWKQEAVNSRFHQELASKLELNFLHPSCWPCESARGNGSCRLSCLISMTLGFL